MAHPKSRHSKQRTRKRRTHYKLSTPNVIKCGNCGEAVLSHHVCKSCGFYRGKQITKATVVLEA